MKNDVKLVFVNESFFSSKEEEMSYSYERSKRYERPCWMIVDDEVSFLGLSIVACFFIFDGSWWWHQAYDSKTVGVTDTKKLNELNSLLRKNVERL